MHGDPRLKLMLTQSLVKLHLTKFNQHIIKILKPIWSTKTETATRVRQRIEAILNWSITLQYSDPPNPATWKGHLENLLPKPNKIRTVKHHQLYSMKLPCFFTNLQNIKASRHMLCNF